VLYADSTSTNAFNERCVGTLAAMCESFASKIGDVDFDRVRNFPLPVTGSIPQIKPDVLEKLKVIRAIDTPNAPSPHNATYLNIEFTDFVVAGKS
jgi:hypothetical protein